MSPEVRDEVELADRILAAVRLEVDLGPIGYDDLANELEVSRRERRPTTSSPDESHGPEEDDRRGAADGAT